MGPLNWTVTAEVDTLVQDLAMLGPDDMIELIKLLDIASDDWRVTVPLLDYFQRRYAEYLTELSRQTEIEDDDL